MTKRIVTPPLNDEAMEKKLVSLAMHQAEEHLRNGTASSQIITHFLRLGSLRAEVELKKLEREVRLLDEKIESEKAGQEFQKQIGEVIAVLKSYSPPRRSYDHDDDVY